MNYPSESIENFISQDEVGLLLQTYRDSEKREKSTGPTVGYLQNEITDAIVDRIKERYGDFEVFRVQFFDVTYPHVIHNDAEPEDDLVERAFLLPLWHNGDSDPLFFTFDQWFGLHPAKFFKDGPEPKNVVTNTPVYDYKDVEYLTDKEFDKQVWHEHFTHIHRHWLDGLSIEKEFKWRPGNMIVFHRHRLHCASDFRKNGVTNKIGLSIFTRKV